MAPLIYPILLLMLGGGVAVTDARQRVEPPMLSARTDLVTLPVTVLDPRGAVVSGLRQEHFVVFDNGEPQAIEFFTSEDFPATLGLVVDSSGSMRGRRDAIDGVAAAFGTLRGPLDEVFTLSFNEEVWPGLAAPALGMTALYDALDRGLQHLQDGTRDRKALVVVSDGGDNASRTTLAAVLERARRAEAAIYSVTLFDPDNRDARPRVLKALAAETGGRVFVAKRPEDVTRSFAQIARELRSGYTIGFAPPETSRGGFRTIRVLVDAGDHRQLIARTRAGYYAGPSRDTAN